MLGNGLFITFEGGEASGKSTQARRLRARLVRSGCRVILLAEPGGTSLGLQVRRLVKFSPAEITPETELLLFLASRAQLVREVVRPALERGEVVVCDRYADSTLAYQGYGRELDVELVRRLNHFAMAGLAPHLTVLLDMPVEEAQRRRRPQTRDRFEGDDLDPEAKQTFHIRVREGYLALVKEEPERWLTVDARLPRVEITRRIWERVSLLLDRTAGG